MNKQVIKAALIGYLREHRAVLAILLCFLLIFSLFGYLFGLPIKAVLYAALLCAAAGAALTAVQLSGFLRRHARLEGLKTSPLNELTPLPAPEGIIQEDYQALLQRALTESACLADKTAATLRDQTEVYSLWIHQVKVPISAMRLVLQQQPCDQAPTLLAELLKVEQYADMALNYARLNASSTDYVIRPCSLDTVLRQLARRFAPLFIQKKLALNYENTSMTVLTDEKWLSFALEQILSNAVKYTKHGSVTILTDPTTQTVTIRDTGIGIAASDLPRVFEQGYTGFNGRTDKRATGLGLYLCKKTLDRLGHSVTLESRPGQGTAVTVALSRKPLHVE